jgi:hypothetical protein
MPWFKYNHHRNQNLANDQYTVQIHSYNSFGNAQTVRKQEPTVDLKSRVNVHGWKSKKTPYLCKIAKEK